MWYQIPYSQSVLKHLPKVCTKFQVSVCHSLRAECLRILAVSGWIESTLIFIKTLGWEIGVRLLADVLIMLLLLKLLTNSYGGWCCKPERKTSPSPPSASRNQVPGSNLYSHIPFTASWLGDEAQDQFYHSLRRFFIPYFQEIRKWTHT
jgi:hypothetical protein